MAERPHATIAGLFTREIIARMNARNVIRLVRPRQWTKNLAVFAALIFAGELFNAPLALKVTLAFLALDLISGGLYAVNDAIDAERDRHHPLKRERPVASGAISRAQAYAIGGVMLAAGLVLTLSLGWGFTVAVAGYLVLQLLYGVLLKHVAIVDMLAIALGFVLRAVAGALVISVPVSPWLVLCTGLLALFLASAKRRHELLLLREASPEHRPVLAEYTAELLDSFMVTLSAATVTSYALYTFFEERAPWYLMMLTIPFVIYGVLRYQSLVLSGGDSGRPEEVLLGDRPILVTVALWAAASVGILYGAPLLVR
ncbi:MAG TPA: decaprenyl-phosphate phosphoribosyltransferase [Coriobacteriia bacterium]|nr:decaprenyl-phosphate phosphoribosyltransferase [Coriobacteriia bacterium]